MKTAATKVDAVDSAEDSASNGDGSNGQTPAPPKAKPGGLGFKSGAKAPGRKS